ncbi:hypothetical protein FK85_27690 [Halorubrum saccharovorum]|uniref:Uncharacterized protein n=1 Tax=Halorubrum saccharovorum TaxID=2248 RepID=A0A0F8AV23_9EURY|nr:hypothetical protein FK85_27690 [Halorubrum saccharovorum]
MTATAEYVDDALVVAGVTDADTVAVYTPDGSELATPEGGEYEFRLGPALDAKTIIVAAANTDGVGDGDGDAEGEDADDETVDAETILGEFSGAGTAVERLRL